MASQHQDLSAVSPYNKQVLLGVGTTFIILPTLVVALRFFSRRKIRADLWWDDWTIIVALVLNTACGTVLLVDATLGGLGEHQQLGPNGQFIHTDSLTIYEKCRYINHILATFNLGVVKTSVLLFYRRIFAVRHFEIANSIMLGVVAVWTIAFTCTMMGQCSPPNVIWDRFEIEYGTDCVNTLQFYQSLAYSDLIMDFLVLALPIPSVLMLKMPWRKKIAVIDILLLTAVVFGSGIARVISYHQVVVQSLSDPMSYFYDETWWTVGPLFWNFEENAVAIIGACLPTLAPLWTHRHRTEKASSGSSGSSWFTKGRLMSAFKTSRGSQSDELPRPMRIGGPTHVEHSSVRNLVDKDIDWDEYANNYPPKPWPPAVIHMQKSFDVDVV